MEMGKIEIGSVIASAGYQTLKAVDTDGSHVSVGRVTYEKNGRIPPEGLAAHEEDEYVVVTKGKLTFGTREKTYELQEGDFHFMPKGTEHWCGGEEEGEFLYILVK